jgi:hypothetical protein
VLKNAMADEVLSTDFLKIRRLRACELCSSGQCSPSISGGCRGHDGVTLLRGDTDRMAQFGALSVVITSSQ